MMQGWKRMLTVVLALLLVLSVVPQGPAVAAETKYGKATKDQVFVRKQPNTGADYWFRVDTNHVAEILETVTQGGKTWYKVKTEHPTDNGHTYTGYIMGDYFTPLTEEETARYLENKTLAQPTATPTAAPSTGSTGTSSSGNTATSNPLGEVTAGGTNFREAAGITGNVIMKLERGTVVELTSIPDTIDENHWYGVRYSGRDGYIMSTYIRRLPEGSGSIVDGASVHGYVKLIKSSAHLRATPGGTISVESGWHTQGEVLPYVSTPVMYDGYTWYEVVYGGVRYWVRGDCVQTVDSTGQTVTGTGPTATADPNLSTGYVLTTQGGVNLRLQPFGESITQIKKGLVLPYTSIVAPYSANNSSSYTWYYVTYENIRGYIRSDCAQPCSANGVATSAPTVTAPPSTGGGTTSTSYGYVKMVKTGVNVRLTPGGTRVDQLAIGTVVPVTGATRDASSYTWYPIRTSSGKYGYVRGDCVSPCDANGNLVSGGTGSTGNAGSTATAAPSGGVYGYVQITMNKTNIRGSMDGSVITRVEKKGGIYPMWGVGNSKNGYTWYPIIVDGRQGWVRGDCAKLVNEDGSSAGGSNSSSSVSTQYIMTIENDVFLRASASKDAAAITNVPKGTVMAYNTSIGSGSSLWYRVIYDNKEVWVLGSCVRIMTQAEYDAWLKDHPNSAPQTTVVAGYVKTTADKVNIRNAANGSTTGKRVEKSGTILPFTDKQTVRGVNWYYIQTGDGFRGWLNGGFVTETDASGKPSATKAPSTTAKPTATPGASGGSSGGYTPPTKGQEASYTNLKYGSTGDAVRKLVAELKAQGYYTGEITSTYTRAVETAVKNFQKAKGLTVDGIAGNNTQHALFQTVPVGQGSSSSTQDFTFYPAEKIDWFTGGIQELWPKGANFKVYDVRTGIVWTAHRWSGFNHADVEPLTAADTARICQMYGVTSADQIKSNVHYARRPSLVQIGTHNYACSLYGVPHNEAGDTIANNNMTGQICIHFTNSRTSDSNVLDSGHQAAIEEAYQKYK